MDKRFEKLTDDQKDTLLTLALDVLDMGPNWDEWKDDESFGAFTQYADSLRESGVLPKFEDPIATFFSNQPVRRIRDGFLGTISKAEIHGQGTGKYILYTILADGGGTGLAYENDLEALETLPERTRPFPMGSEVVLRASISYTQLAADNPGLREVHTHPKGTRAKIDLINPMNNQWIFYRLDINGQKTNLVSEWNLDPTPGPSIAS